MNDDAVPRPWQFEVSGVLYAVQFRPQLDQEVVDTVAGKIRDGVGLTGGPQAYLRAIGEALAQDGDLTALVPAPHGETEVRAFLAALRSRLEQEPSGPAR